MECATNKRSFRLRRFIFEKELHKWAKFMIFFDVGSPFKCNLWLGRFIPVVEELVE